jgi:chemotaxis protein MotB
MYSIANQDKAKIKQITESIEKTFFGPSTKVDIGTGAVVNILSNATSMKGQVIDQPTGHTNALPDKTPELAAIAKRIEESLAFQLQTTDLKDNLQMVYDDRGLVVRMSLHDLFVPGKEAVQLSHLPILDKVGDILAKTDRLIRVEGHTDNSLPPADSKFPTNWELSAARASWVVRYIRAKFKIPMQRLATAGYADGQPLALNDTEEGRAKNRRLEFVITNLKVKE